MESDLDGNRDEVVLRVFVQQTERCSYVLLLVPDDVSRDAIHYSIVH